MKKFLALSLSDVVVIMLINVKMPTIAGILTFMSRINFMLNWIEHGKSFITSGPGNQSIVHRSCIILAILIEWSLKSHLCQIIKEIWSWHKCSTSDRWSPAMILNLKKQWFLFGFYFFPLFITRYFINRE